MPNIGRDPFLNFQHKSRSEVHERWVVTGRQNTREKDWMNLICLITFQTTFKCGLNLICKKNQCPCSFCQLPKKADSLNNSLRTTNSEHCQWTRLWQSELPKRITSPSLLCHGCWLRWSTGLIPKNVVLISHFKPKYINWSPRLKHTRCTLYLFHTETGSGTISGLTNCF